MRDLQKEAIQRALKAEAQVKELKEENRRLREVADLACRYKELVKNFVDGLHCERRSVDSLEFFYRGIKTLEQADAEFDKAIELAREVIEGGR